MSAYYPTPSHNTDVRFGKSIVLVAILLLIIPALLVRVPPLLDYPNHYVRLWLIAGGVNLPPLSQMYAFSWSGAWTNIAIDLIAWVLGGLVPVTVIGPLVLMLAITLRPLGIMMLGQSLFGTARWWHVLCFILAWNWALIAGFINFEISLGLALLSAALDVRLARHGAGVLVPLRIIAGATTLVAHPFGYLFYAALISGLALGPSFIALRSLQGLRQAFVRIVLACLPITVPAIILILFAPALPGGNTAHHAIVWQQPTISAHISILLTGIKTYRFSVDAIFGVLLASPIFLALILHRLRFHAGLLIITIVLTIGSLLMPQLFFGAAGVDTRLPCMVALCLGVAVLPDFGFSRRGAAVATALAMLVVAGRTAWIGHVWLARQSDFASLERVLKHIPAGASVLPMEHLPAAAQIRQAPIGRFLGGINPLFWHEPTLAIMDRHAFVPNLFTAAGEQPIRVLPPWNDISAAAGPIEPVNQLGNPDLLTAPYLGRWHECFDYILVVNADMPNAKGPLPQSPAIVPVADEGFARLYKITHDSQTKACH